MNQVKPGISSSRLSASNASFRGIHLARFALLFLLLSPVSTHAQRAGTTTVGSSFGDFPAHGLRPRICGSVTLKHMQKVANSLGCRFVYAIVPDERIEDVINDQATRKATKLVQRVSGHMALESQSLPLEKTQAEIVRLRDELMRNMPSDFWEAR